MTQKDAEYEIAEAREIGESTTNPRSLAYRLKLRELLGEKLTAAQRRREKTTNRIFGMQTWE